MTHTMAIGLVALGLAFALCGCGADEWKCAPPAGALSAEGDFEIEFVGETASFRSNTMQVAIASADDDAIEVWACQERGEEMWIAEVSVSRGTRPTLPAALDLSAAAPRFRAWLTRYDKYQLLEDELGDGLGAQISGSLSAFDADQGALVLDGNLSEPCNLAQCQANRRSIAVSAELSWP